ncbi:MAG TPA: peptide chain release factor N(5)-glutamine methyltransferase [Dehalococcoidia bacterium]|nr:peptide chain release factor N(5)-glutamine methyltransferase [Dehalococcoidia bacterium]
MTIGDNLRAAAARISEAGSDEAALEAEILLMHAAGLDRAQLYARLEDALPPDQARAFASFVDRRLAHEPVPYITGHKEFFALDFEVTPAALIPRPESEMLVELVLLFAEKIDPAALIADIGTGSGAIAVSLAHALPNASVIATDVSAQALDLARRNAERHGVADRIDFRCGDVLAPLDGPVDVIVTNLPYVRTDEWRSLPPELAEHEPRIAFDGGADGLILIRRLLRDAPSRLRPGGALFAEISYEQGEAVLALVEEAFPGASSESRKDLANLDRVLCVYT